ncbi:hypothetical protein CCR75_004630 [Bremia lactucae]|uniref:Uncharacterized protein n=1 Tax=Bremia lactucae TaxID=4779 RepID=A0A976ILY6_BRELC|nr:hypothetical protein CCR75_004630 [Bremia lactucae]
MHYHEIRSLSGTLPMSACRGYPNSKIVVSVDKELQWKIKKLNKVIQCPSIPQKMRVNLSRQNQPTKQRGSLMLRLGHNTTCHPRFDLKLTDRFIGDYLRGVVNPAQDNWNSYLRLAQIAYNRRLGYVAYMPDDVASDAEFKNLDLKMQYIFKLTRNSPQGRTRPNE